MSLLSPAQLKEKFPWVNTEDVALASYGKAKLLSNNFDRHGGQNCQIVQKKKEMRLNSFYLLFVQYKRGVK